MKISTEVFALWFILVCPAAQAGTISTNGSAPQTLARGAMLTMDGIATTPERKTSPLFHGTSLPMPPMQDLRWKIPESQLPTNYISATRILFEQGLADPRDCDYRVIEVGTGNVWGATVALLKHMDGFYRAKRHPILQFVGTVLYIRFLA